MAKIDSTVLTPGANALINTEPKEDTPPEGFIDNTVRVYRMNPDGTKGEHLRDESCFPEGWGSLLNNTIKRRPEDEEETRGEETMPKTEVENWPEVIKRGMELINDGAKPFTAATQLVQEFNLPVKPQSVFPKLKKAMEEAEKKAAEKETTDTKDHDKKTPETPSKEQLLSMWKLYDGDCKRIADFLDTTCSVVKKWLREAGIIDQFGTPILQTENAGETDPPEKKDAEETATEPEPQPERKDEANEPAPEDAFDQLREQLKKGVVLVSFGPFNLAPIKLQLIAATLAEYRVGSCPSDIALQVIKKISVMEVSNG